MRIYNAEKLEIPNRIMQKLMSLINFMHYYADIYAQAYQSAWDMDGGAMELPSYM